MNDALELVDGFSADQDPVHAEPKWRLRDVVAQVDRIPPLPPLARNGFAAQNGAIGGDRAGLASNSYSIAIFPNLGIGMLAAQQLLKSYGPFTINQILGPLSGTGQSNTVNATTTAVLSASGLDGNATISSLSQVQINILIASFMSQSEGFHPASCGW